MRTCLSSKPFEATAFLVRLSTLRNHKTSTTFSQLCGLNPEERSPLLRAIEDVFRGDIEPIFRHEPRRKHSNLRKDHLEVFASDA